MPLSSLRNVARGISGAIRGALAWKSKLPLASKRPPLSEAKARRHLRLELDLIRALEGKPMRFRWATPAAPTAASEQAPTGRGEP